MAVHAAKAQEAIGLPAPRQPFGGSHVHSQGLELENSSLPCSQNEIVETSAPEARWWVMLPIVLHH